MSRLTLYRQPKSTDKSNYIAETLLEIYDVEELPDGTFTLKFITIDHYQMENPVIQAKLLCEKIEKNLFVEAGIILHW